MSDTSSSVRRLLDLDTDFDLEFESEELARLVLSGDPFRIDGASQGLGGTRLSGRGSRGFALGGKESPVRLKLGASAAARAELSVVWERGGLDESMEAELGVDLDFERDAVLALELEAEAGVGVEAGAPIGAYLSAGGTARTGQGIRYCFYSIFEKGLPAGAALRQFFRALRWPLQSGGSARDMAEGTVAVLSLRGQVAVSASATAGYETRGSPSVDVKGLRAAFHYQVSVGARLAAEFRMGGAFQVSTRAGSQSGWARLQLRRSREQARQVSAGLDFGGAFKVDGLATSPEGLLGALTGLNVSAAVDWLDRAAGCDSWEAASAALQARYGSFVAEAASEFFEEVLGSKDFQALQAWAGEALTDLSELGARADRRLLELSQRLLPAKKEAVEQLDRLLEATTREGLAELADGSVWELLELVAGDAVFGLLNDQEIFVETRAKARRLRRILGEDTETTGLRRLMEETQRRLNIDAVVDGLATVGSRAKFKQMMVGEAGKLAQRIFDFASDEIGRQDVFRKVKGGAVKLKGFREKVASALENGFQRKLELSLAASFAAETGSSAMLDIEIDLSKAAGRACYEKAIRGDFRAALGEVGAKHVRVRRGELQRQASSAGRLSAHAFGWGVESLSRMEQLESVELRQQGSGCLFLFGSETSLDTRFRKGYGLGELTATAFSIRAQAQALAKTEGKEDRFYRGAVEALSSDYAVTQEDDTPSWDELERYLHFAAQLGIAESGRALATALREEFAGREPSYFKIKYTVRYSENAFGSVFLAYDEELKDLASKAFRQYFADRYYSAKRSFFSEESLASYLTHARIDERGWSARHHSGRKRYYIYDEQGNRDVVRFGSALYRAYLAEKRFKDALMRLDLLLDAIAEDGDLSEHRMEALNGALYDLVAVPRTQMRGVWKENLFFLVMDALQREADPEARKGRTTLQIEFGFGDGEPLRRLYTV